MTVAGGNLEIGMDKARGRNDAQGDVERVQMHRLEVLKA